MASVSNSSNNKTFFKNFSSTAFHDSPISSQISEIICLTINQTGTRVINTRTDKSIRIWKCYPDKLVDPIIIENPHLKAVERISWNPRTEFTFASVGRDELVKIWRCNGLLDKEIKVSKNGGGDIISQIVEYSYDGEVLSVVDRDSTITFYSVNNNYDKIGEVKVNEHIYDFSWFNEGHSYFLCALHNGNLPLYRVEEKKEEGNDNTNDNDNDDNNENNNNNKLEVTHHHTLRGHRSSATCLSLNPRGIYFAVGSNEGVVSIWSTKTMINNRVITSIDEAISYIDISRDGTYLAVAYDSGSNIRIFDYESTEEVHEIPNSMSGSLVLPQIKWFPSKTAFIFTSDNGRTMSLGTRQ